VDCRGSKEGGGVRPGCGGGREVEGGGDVEGRKGCRRWKGDFRCGEGREGGGRGCEGDGGGGERESEERERT
jgi:hypothetical protein